MASLKSRKESDADPDPLVRATDPGIPDPDPHQNVTDPPQHCLAGAEDRHEAEDVARRLAAARRRRRHNVFHEGLRVRQRGAYEEDVVRAAL